MALKNPLTHMRNQLTIAILILLTIVLWFWWFDPLSQALQAGL